ncbi:hypothetical protein D3C75_972280 [compost metagenome]
MGPAHASICSPWAKTNCRLSLKPGACAGQWFICNGKLSSTKAYPTIAGLNTLRPAPPKACLPRPMAIPAAITGNHHGAPVGRARARSTAVTKALPSLSADVTGWLRNASAAASQQTAVIAHSPRLQSRPHPSSQNEASRPGRQANKTRPMALRRRGSGGAMVGLIA